LRLGHFNGGGVDMGEQWVCGCEDDAGVVEVWEHRGWLRGEHGLGLILAAQWWTWLRD
jgi:hypothetical protein